MTLSVLENAPQATLTLEEAAARTWDVLVAGAGPAGAVTAHGLARLGAAVLLVDKAAYPRAKVCGSCLNGGALAALAAAGLGDLPRRLGAVPLGELRIRAGRREASLPLPVGAAISRRALDAALVEAAVQGGAAFLPQTAAVLDPLLAAERVIRLRRDGRQVTVRARLAVAADGLAGGFVKELSGMKADVLRRAPIGAGAVLENAPRFYQSGTVFMACAPTGYVGLVRLEDGRLDVAAALNRRHLRGPDGAAVAVAAILDHCGFACPESLSATAFHCTPPLTRRRGCVAAPGLFVLGDAAGYIEPFTGEGMSWAMQEAVLLAPLAKEALAGPTREYALHWQRQYERFFRRRRPVCQVVSWMHHHFALGVAAVAVLKQMPSLAAPWVRAVNRPCREIRRRMDV